MAHLYALLAMTFAPFVVGVTASIFVHRVPRHGWVGLLLVLLSGLFWGLSEPSDSSAPERLWTLPCFTFFAPVAVIYAFRSHKVAPDRLFATAAFIGSFLIAVALLFMLFGSAYMAFTIIASPNHALQPTPVGVGSSAFAVQAVGPAWLSLGR